MGNPIHPDCEPLQPTAICHQLADWLEFYAEALELNVWTSSVATHAEKDPLSGKWLVTVKRGDGSERIFRVDHLVFALGLGGGSPNIPDIPGRVCDSVISTG